MRKRRRRSPAPQREDHGERSAEGERLQKVLAAAGIASRRECELLIQEGRVEVDGQLVTELGTRVDRQRQEIHVDGEPLPRPKLAYYAVHKPPGVISTARDPSGRIRVIDLLPPDAPRVFNVGRLDMSSEGLILLTNDGDLTAELTHPRYGVAKTYHVQVAGHPNPATMAQLRRGMHLAEGFARVQNARIKSRRQKSTILEIVLDEGRNREIRRLLAKTGHKVERLVRVAVGPVRLGELPVGAVRPLTRDEIKALREVVAQGRAAQPPRKAARRRGPKSDAQQSKRSEKSPRRVTGAKAKASPRKGKRR